MLLRDKEEPSMVSEVDLHNQLLFLLLFLPTKSPLRGPLAIKLIES
jgi:hypothetical protein